MMGNRGYFGIGIYHTKTKANVGTLWRSAFNFGAAFIFTIGRRYEKQSSDTVRADKHIPLYHYITFEEFYENTPFNCQLIAIEQSDKSVDVKKFTHPERCIYLLGAEDHGLPDKILDKSKKIVHIDTPQCLNVATAGSIIMFDRLNKGS
jgi:tRNA (guanosine-2'-O-)-methyltransferase